ncbi:MAG: transposase [Methanothrix sp.]|nr:transposase [Methanothrix sp.]
MDFSSKREKGGRPNCNVILMFMITILQQWYGLSDLEVERQMVERISFMSFRGFPNSFPDSRIIWLFRERMAKTGKYECACNFIPSALEKWRTLLIVTAGHQEKLAFMTITKYQQRRRMFM